MTHYEKFAMLKSFTDKVGSIYGTEDFCVYLYSIIKMTKPKTVLELGTGFGTTTLWSALALQENDLGKIHTFDDGREWSSLSQAKERFDFLYNEDYQTYIKNLFNCFELSDRIVFSPEEIKKVLLTNIDILFCDFSHGPYAVIKFLADYLANMSDNSYIFIDSASTYYPSYQTLESVVNYFNQGKIPQTVLEEVSLTDLDKFKSKVLSSKFELSHLIENKSRNQNSTTQIKISPIDIMPQPRINIRF